MTSYLRNAVRLFEDPGEDQDAESLMERLTDAVFAMRAEIKSARDDAAEWELAAVAHHASAEHLESLLVQARDEKEELIADLRRRIRHG